MLKTLGSRGQSVRVQTGHPRAEGLKVLHPAVKLDSQPWRGQRYTVSGTEDHVPCSTSSEPPSSALNLWPGGQARGKGPRMTQDSHHLHAPHHGTVPRSQRLGGAHFSKARAGDDSKASDPQRCPPHVCSAQHPKGAQALCFPLSQPAWHKCLKNRHANRSTVPYL